MNNLLPTKPSCSISSSFSSKACNDSSSALLSNSTTDSVASMPHASPTTLENVSKLSAECGVSPSNSSASSVSECLSFCSSSNSLAMSYLIPVHDVISSYFSSTLFSSQLSTSTNKIAAKNFMNTSSRKTTSSCLNNLSHSASLQSVGSCFASNSANELSSQQNFKTVGSKIPPLQRVIPTAKNVPNDNQVPRGRKTVILEGWINKWTNIMSSWRPRYFILEKGILKYSLSENGPIKETFLLSQCDIRLCPGDPVRLEVDTLEQGTLFLRTETTEEKSQWYVAFKQAKKMLLRNLNSMKKSCSPLMIQNKNEVNSKVVDNSTIQKNENNSSVATSNSKDEKSAISNERTNAKCSQKLPKSKEVIEEKHQEKNIAIMTEESNAKSKPPYSYHSSMLEEKSPLVCMIENVVACRQHVECATNEIRSLQSKIINEVGILSSIQNTFLSNSSCSSSVSSSPQQHTQMKESRHTVQTLKKLSISLLQRVDFLSSVVDQHLIATETYIAEENAQRRQLEKSIKWLAKQNYRLEIVQEQSLSLSEDKKVLREGLRGKIKEFAKEKMKKIEEGSLGRAEEENSEITIQDILRRKSKNELYNEDDEEDDEDEDIEFFECEEEEKNENANNHLSDFNLKDSMTLSVDDSDCVTEEKVKENEKEKIENSDKLIAHSEFHKHRIKLPKPRTDFKIRLWTILKDCIGKDLSRISMPVYFNEPTSFIQRLAEDFQYEKILRKATKIIDTTERLCWIVLFACTPYESAVGRTYKPFNPLLGETYEISHRGYNFLSEQVGHHPPVAAYHVESEYFVVWGHLVVKNKLLGKSLEVTMPGPIHIVLPQTASGDHYTYNRARMLIHNVIFGRLWIELEDCSLLLSYSSNDWAIMQFIRKGWFDKAFHQFRALILDSNHLPRYKLEGCWSSDIYMQQVSPSVPLDVINHVKKRIHFVLNREKATSKDNENSNPEELTSCRWIEIASKLDSRTLEEIIELYWEHLKPLKGSPRRLMWRPDRRPENSEQYFGFGYMTMELNEISKKYDPAHGAIMPPTDSRFRPDQRAYEEGDIEKAIDEKHRLEEKQRAASRARINGEADYKPMWFEKSYDKITGEDVWLYKGNYWESKKRGLFEGCVDIF